ncbi:MAG TPA: hypothetical protein VEA99_09190 [Gemmatimonadaceae bacterium]|nr:hypothetical protein [Gemmatimonadaceae bacterium]
MPIATRPESVARRSRRAATSPTMLVALLAAGALAVSLPELEARRREATDEALGRSATQVVTLQRAHVARTGHFYAARRWLREGEHERLVLPLAAEHRVLTYYSAGQRGLVVVVGDVTAQRTCAVVVRVHPTDRPTRLACGDERVPE